MAERDEDVEPAAASGRRSAQPLDEAELDDIAARTASLPEPLASLALWAEVARSSGDATGVRRRLFELGTGVVRYAVAVGLARLGETLAGSRISAPLARELGGAARLSDGQWCALGRAVASEVKRHDPEMARRLRFVGESAVSRLVEERNLFAHGGGAGDEAPRRAREILDAAAELCALPLRVPTGPDAFEVRAGLPLRAGVWRKTREAPPPSAAEVPHLVVADRWLPLAPFLPTLERRLLLPESPHRSGKPWRSLDPDTGERHEHRGLDEAIRRLVGECDDTPRPLVDRPPLIGRGTAAACVTRAIGEALAGGVRIVALTGPMGVGRSRLLAEAVDAARRMPGFRVALLGSGSRDRRTALGTLRLAVRGEAAMAPVAAAVERALAGDALAKADVWEAALEAVEEALLEATTAAPTLLAIDDLQWADDATLRVLRLLCERAALGAAGKLCVLCAVRDEPGPPVALRRLLGEIEREVGSAATRLTLGPLADPEAHALVQGMGPVDRALEDALVGAAGGLPFYLVQPLCVLAETASLAWSNGAWRPTSERVLAAALPGVADLVRARLASFFEEATRVEVAAEHLLAIAALADTPLGAETVLLAAAGAGDDARDAEHALETLCEAGLLALSAHGVGFEQPIVREAALALFGSKIWFRRVRRALCEVLAGSSDADADARFLAAGYAALGDARLARHWQHRAVDRAFARGDLAAAALEADALAGLLDGEERLQAELRTIEALLGMGELASVRERIAAQAPPASVPSPSLRLALRIARHRAAFDVGASAEQSHDELLGEAASVGDARLEIEARLAVAASLRGARGLEVLGAALDARLELVERGAATELAYRRESLRCELCWEISSDRDELRRAILRARNAAQALGSVWADLEVRNDLAVLETEEGRHDRAAELFSALAEAATGHRLGTHRRRALVNVASSHLRAERWREAAEAASLAAGATRAAADWRHLSVARSVEAEARLRLGEHEAALAAADEAVGLKIAHGDPAVAVALVRRAEARSLLGDHVRARADAQQGLERACALGSADDETLARLWLGIDAAEHDGRRDELRDLVHGVETRASDLRPATRRMLQRARELLLSSR
jgi:hypothetical protein